MSLQSYSQHSFFPFSKQLKPVGPLARFDLLIRANRVNERISSFVGEQNNSQADELHFIKNSDYRVGIYGDLGRGTHSDALAQDILSFIQEQKKESSIDLSFWAVFYDTIILSEVEFQEELWKELNCFSDSHQIKRNFEIEFKRDSKNNINFKIGDDTYMITGMHNECLVSSRRFHYATLVFTNNYFSHLYQTH